MWRTPSARDGRRRCRNRLGSCRRDFLRGRCRGNHGLRWMWRSPSTRDGRRRNRVSPRCRNRLGTHRRDFSRGRCRGSLGPVGHLVGNRSAGGGFGARVWSVIGDRSGMASGLYPSIWRARNKFWARATDLARRKIVSREEEGWLGGQWRGGGRTRDGGGARDRYEEENACSFRWLRAVSGRCVLGRPDSAGRLSIGPFPSLSSILFPPTRIWLTWRTI